VSTISIRYRLSKIEILRSYLHALKHSPRLLLIVLTYCAATGVFVSALRGSFAGPSAIALVVEVFVVALIVFSFSLFLVFALGKTAERILTVSQDGITTQIGSLKGKISWSKVKSVSKVGSEILIVGASGNAFFIPDRAFLGSEHVAEFLHEVARWRSLE
jgi:hypothetical protein